MIRIFDRIRNLWLLSAYKPSNNGIVKEITTMKKKMATIVMPEKVDVLKEQLPWIPQEDDNTN